MYSDAGGEVRETSVSLTGAAATTCDGIRFVNSSTAETTTTLKLFGVTCLVTSNSGTNGRALNVLDNGATQDNYCYAYNSSFTESGAVTVNYGVQVLGGDAYFYGENCVINGSQFDIFNSAGTCQLRHCCLVSGLTSGAVTYSGYTTNGGTVKFIPLGESISQAITDATAGDTLILAAGTYTITSAIGVSKAVNIIGQGVGQTIVNCATDTTTVFNVTADNVRIAHLSVTHSGAGTVDTGIYVNGSGGTVLSAVKIYNVSVSLSGAATSNNNGIYYLDAGGEVRSAVVSVSNAVTSNGITHQHNSTAETTTTLKVYDSSITSSGTTNARGFMSLDNSATQDNFLYAYNCTASASGASTQNYGVFVSGGDAYFYDEGSVFNGSGYDAYNSSGGILQLRGSTLINATIYGTITYDGYQTFEDLGQGKMSKDVSLDGSGLNSMLSHRDGVGSVFFDSSVSSTRIFHTMSQNIGSSDFTLWVRAAVPSSNPSVDGGLMSLSSSTSSAVVASAFTSYITSSTGALVIKTFGAGGTSDQNSATLSSFITNFGGKIVDIMIVRNATTPSLTVYVNGVVQTVTEASGGTPPTWANSITSTYALLGAYSSTTILNDRMYRAVLFNRALSAAEVCLVREREVSFADQWGNMTLLIDYSTPTLNGGFETAGGGGADVFANWSEGTSGSSTVNDETTNVHSGSHACRLDVDASNSDVYVSSAVTTVGKKYKYSLWAYGSTGSPTIKVGGSATDYTNTHTLTNSYAQYTGEFTANTTSFYIDRDSAASTSIYIDDVQLNEIGCMLNSDLEHADPAVSTTVRDRSSNNFLGTSTATGVTQIKQVKEYLGTNITITGTLTAGSISGPTLLPVTSVATNTTLALANAGLVVANAASGAVTLTLPASTLATGFQYTVKKVDTTSNVVYIDGNAAETIDGSSSLSLIDAQYDVITIACSGTTWYIIDRGAVLG
jgi:hypothetical protein